MSENRTSYRYTAPRRIPSLFWPIVLIVGGILLLLSNLGYLPEPSWNIFWRLWPVFLIALGIDVLIGRRSVVGAIVSGILIFLLVGGIVLVSFFAHNIPAIAGLARSPELQHESIAYPLTGLEQATVIIDWTSLEGTLEALDDSDNLIEGEIDYYGDLIFDVEVENSTARINVDSMNTEPVFYIGSSEDSRDGNWDIALSPDVLLDLTLDSGSGEIRCDLTALQLEALDVDSGSGGISLVLPAASSFAARLDSSSGDVEIVLPANIGLRIDLDSGSGHFRTDERFRLVSGDSNDEDGIWETENYATADYTIELRIDQGSGDITTRE